MIDINKAVEIAKSNYGNEYCADYESAGITCYHAPNFYDPNGEWAWAMPGSVIVFEGEEEYVIWNRPDVSHPLRRSMGLVSCK
jgi:hypothetical protein